MGVRGREIERERVRHNKTKSQSQSKSSSQQIRVRAQATAEFKSAGTLKRFKLGCDETGKNFARSELDKV